MSEFKALLRAALRGQSEGEKLPEPTGPLAPVLARLPDGPLGLLRSAGAQALQIEIASSLESRTLKLLDLPGLDTAPLPLADEDASVIEALNSITYPDSVLWTSWLKQRQRRGQAVPAALWPVLLAKARPGDGLHRLLWSWSDPRAKLLGQANPKWSYILWPRELEAVKAAFPHAPENQRLIMLAQLLRTDPSDAQALLESDWPRLPAQQRVTWLKELGRRLTSDFLLNCLEDRARQVREAASLLLVPRALEKFDEVATAALNACLVGSTQLDALQGPEKLTDDLKWLGLPEKPAQTPRATWLTGLITRAPLGFWARFGSPAGVLKQLEKHVWKGSILEGLHAAANLRCDSTWTQCLADHTKKTASATQTSPTATVELAFYQLIYRPKPWDESTCKKVTEAIWARLSQNHSEDLTLQEIGQCLTLLINLPNRFRNRLPRPTPRPGNPNWELVATLMPIIIEHQEDSP